jgi:hypothetical protein
VKYEENQPKATDPKLRALLSLNQDEYAKVLGMFDELVKRKLRHYTLKNQRRVHKDYKERTNSSLYGSEKKLDFVLMYLKENPNQSYHGCLFSMCQAKVSQWVSYLTPVLEESLRLLGFMPQAGHSYRHREPNTDCLLVDVTERQVPRHQDYDGQKQEYSGKKKLHRVKNMAITTAEGYILYMSPCCQGSVHDKALWDSIDVEHTPLNLLADLGFAGVEKGYPNVILPYKKPRNGQITDLQKSINREISKIRVRVEHAFAGVKRLKIIKNKIRLRKYHIRDSMMNIAAALHNLRHVSRKPIINHS